MRCVPYSLVPSTEYRVGGERVGREFLLVADNCAYDLGEDLWDDEFGGCSHCG
jgi:hypothetical protein